MLAGAMSDRWITYRGELDERTIRRLDAEGITRAGTTRGAGGQAILFRADDAPDDAAALEKMQAALDVPDQARLAIAEPQ